MKSSSLPYSVYFYNYTMSYARYEEIIDFCLKQFGPKSDSAWDVSFPEPLHAPFSNLENDMCLHFAQHEHSIFVKLTFGGE